MAVKPTHWRDTDPPIETMICDLCFGPGVRWCYISPSNCTQEEWDTHRDDPDYLAADGQPLWWIKDERWASCQTCYLLVEGGRVKELKQRVYEGHKKRGKIRVVQDSPALTVAMDYQARMEIDHIVDCFMRYRQGEPLPEPYDRATRIASVQWEAYSPTVVDSIPEPEQMRGQPDAELVLDMPFGAFDPANSTRPRPDFTVHWRNEP